MSGSRDSHGRFVKGSGSGAKLSVRIEGLDRLQAKLAALGAIEQGELLQVIGATVESQVKRRIHEEKAAPDGTEWSPWSADYAETRHANQGLLESEGHLLTSIQFLVGEGQVEVGSNLIYAATHQYGRGPIPARPYLGLSAQNEQEVVAVVEEFLERAANAT